jgi:hypothetical protein
MGLERVKDQEKRREQENHNVGRGPTKDRNGLSPTVIGNLVNKTAPGHSETSLPLRKIN